MKWYYIFLIVICFILFLILLATVIYFANKKIHAKIDEIINDCLTNNGISNYVWNDEQIYKQMFAQAKYLIIDHRSNGWKIKNSFIYRDTRKMRELWNVVSTFYIKDKKINELYNNNNNNNNNFSFSDYNNKTTINNYSDKNFNKNKNLSSNKRGRLIK